MDYCTIEDIETQTSTPTLIQLTSDDGQEAVNRVVALEAVLYSSTLIDGYLRGRYSLPLNTHFPLLRILAIDLIDSICETVNQFIRTLIGRGALIDGKCSFNSEKNPTTEIANGHLTFDIEFMPPTPAERITFESFINIELLKSLGAS